MNKKQKERNSGGIVYSTDPNYQFQKKESRQVTPSPEEQRLRLSLDRKQRRGKEVTLLTGFVGDPADLESLSKTLKVHCGTGGSVKDGEIILQGDQREKSSLFLKGLGYRVMVIN